MKRQPKEINPKDREIGMRIRALRTARNMTQQGLGEHLGVTFQQVQKYEKGANRVGGSRIQRLAEVLQCSPSYLINGPAGAEVETLPTGMIDLLHSHEGQRMLRVFSRMPEEVRRRFLKLAEAISVMDAPDAVVAVHPVLVSGHVDQPAH